MKILHLCSYFVGGAGIACRRLHEALLASGVESVMMTKRDFCPESDVNTRLSIPFRLRRKTIHILKKFHKNSNPILHSDGIVSCADIDFINNSEYDIINLHWINDGFLSICEIAKIKKPLVWTVHDTWPFSGCEHYPNVLENDIRYLQGYHSGNFPKSSSGPDLDKWVWRWKKYCWKNQRFHFVAPSHWEAESCKSSALFRGYDCAVIPNPLDLGKFKQDDRIGAREFFNLPQNKKIILFGAQAADNPIKGIQYLKPALESLATANCCYDSHMVCFGKGNKNILEGIGLPYTFIGSIDDEKTMAKLYNTADVFVCPSVIDNLPNTCVESVSCGTPVAAFCIGGIPEIVSHEENGYLAKPYEPDDLAKGILYCLENHDRLSGNARQYAEEHFSQEIVAKKYIAFYEEVLRMFEK